MTNQKKRLIGLVTALALLVVPAFVVQHYGLYADYKNDDVVAVKVDLPAEIGDWTRTEAGDDLADYVVNELGLIDYDCQRYEKSDGKQSTLLLMYGHSGRLIRHPPDICYAAGGLTDKKTIEPFEFADQFSLAGIVINRRSPNSLVNESFVVVHGFYDGANWSSPRFPRIALGGKRCLYKLQFLFPLERSNGPSDSERAEIVDFLTNLRGANL